jgi:glycosyltransferase involved in cell wall biosynthesis
MTYALVSPVLNEVENLPRLVTCLRTQSLAPDAWLIVDTGSTDGTVEFARDLADELDWVNVIAIPPAEFDRGRPIVDAIHEGFAALTHDPPDVVVKLDADISMAPDYFERLMAAFAVDDTLGMASGSAYELESGVWVRRHMTGDTVWGASRAYRWACLQDVLPLEERMGWDGIDQLKANMRGWRSTILLDLPFRHHRLEGEREGARRTAWAVAGRASHYMGYRPWYLVARALHHAKAEPAALALISGYAGAALRREPQCPDASVRAYLKKQQSLSALPQRMREALGRG